MDILRQPLPDFENPPVVEVAIALHFEELPLRTAHFGAFWNSLRSELPFTEDHHPLVPAIESFGIPTQSPRVEVQAFNVPPLARCWFRNEASTQLLQLQNNLFVLNWRQTKEDKQRYPRYTTVRNLFEQRLNSFCSFLDTENLGPLVPKQCELTYVNHLAPTHGEWSTHGDVDQVLTIVKQEYSDDFLGPLENLNLNARYLIPGTDGAPIGRLHISETPVFRADDQSPLIQLNLTARGAVPGNEMKDILRFIDIGHVYIVKAFASITRAKQHKAWGRQDDRRPDAG